MLLVFAQQRVASPASLIFEGLRVVVLGISLDPVVDTLSGYSERAGNVGGGATVVELQDGKGTPI